MIDLVATARGEFRAADKLMRFTRPDEAEVGDELVVMIVGVHAETLDTAHPPSGWGHGVNGTTTNYNQYAYTHAVLVGEDARIDFPLQAGGAVAHEWLGFLLVVRGAADNCVEEISGQEFSATTSPPQSGSGSVEQATDLFVGFNIAANTTTVIAGSFFNNAIWYPTVAVDSFAQAVFAPFTMSVVSRRAGETLASVLGFTNGNAGAPVTGLNLTLVLRAGRPLAAADTLFDVVPGNIGLVGVDARAGAGSVGTAAESTGIGGSVGH